MQIFVISLLFFAAAVLSTADTAIAQNGVPAGPGRKTDWSARFVYSGQDQRLHYDQSPRGDRIPDFSHCGYGGGGIAIPQVPARFELEPSGADDTDRIQQAVNRLSSEPLRSDGFRGAIQLRSGIFQVSGSIRLVECGIVIRGTGDSAAPTMIRATGNGRRSLILIDGSSSVLSRSPEPVDITDAYVPCGASSVTVGRPDQFSIGDLICVEHPSTAAWISALRMDQFPTRDSGSWLDWKPGTRNIRWLRSVTQIDGRRLHLDAPLSMSLDAALSPASVRRCDTQGLVQQCGIENLTLVSTFESRNPLDEDHAWTGITIREAQDVWIRDLRLQGFCGSAVDVQDSCRRVTVMDCRSTEPVSEHADWRRRTFHTTGTQTLFMRCSATDGRQDFSTGHLAAGPNVFAFCESHRSSDFSGPAGSWGTGVLYDNVTIDGAALALANQETAAQGTGWSAANCVLWNCVAPVVICRMPPQAQNWAIGVWGEFVGDGHWRQLNEFVSPDSLLIAQLTERLGPDVAGVLKPQPIRRDAAELLQPEPPQATAPVASRPLTLDRGRLLIEGKPAIGRRIGTQWWRGSVLPDRVPEFAPGITRFVPGRDGIGMTDPLASLADQLQRDGILAVEHHWGLWYDRRRDDHQIVRRIDGAVWPPFYEQPWARSGRGTAWDGLSLYDLTQFNPWYFNRLQEFAGHCDQRGLVLVQHMYFQHNLLESAAHWADFPWRPANCLQTTGFAEPPELENRKRIAVAREFWDLSHPVRRQLHERYIEHCLDTLSTSQNVIFTTGEEYTGPLEFVEFWLRTIAAWQQRNSRDVFVVLSCTKDVQDAILDNPDLEPIVDIIDLKYWWYTPSGQVFAPEGGTNLAPRQQVREHSGDRSRTSQSVARAVSEYCARFPEKAVICSFPDMDPGVISSAGGSFTESMDSVGAAGRTSPVP